MLKRGYQSIATDETSRFLAAKTVKKNALFSAVAASLLSASAAQAAVLEEVVVTAQKYAQSVNDVGITVNAFTGDTIKDLGVATAEDVAAFTPGLTVTQGGATGVAVYTIRGVGGFQDLTTSSSSTVGLYFDEVAIPYTVMSRGALYDIERVEVLKGPQGDLYGRNTTAGQINYISKKPTEEFEAGFTVSYGRFDVFDLEGFVSGALSDAVQARVAVKTTQSSEGWQNSLTRSGDELGEKDISAIRSLFNFNLSDNGSLLLNLRYVDDQSDNMAGTAFDGRDIGQPEFRGPTSALAPYRVPGVNAVLFGTTPPWYSTDDNRDADWTNIWVSPQTGEVANLRPRRDNQLQGLSAKLEWDFDGMTLTSLTAYDEFERVEVNDVDAQPATVQSNINETDMEVFSQELRLSGETDNLLWIAGLYYSKDDVDEFYNFFMQDSVFGEGSAAFGLMNGFAANPIYRLHTRYQQETESQAIFGHLEYSVTDKMRITVGARYTEEDREWSGCTFDAGDGFLAAFWNATPFAPTLQPGDCATLNDGIIASVVGTPNINDAFAVFETEISTEKWMGKLGVDYALTDDLLIYATLSNAFKSGGFNGNNSNTTGQLQPYEPEEIEAFELGIKATLLEGSMQLNAAIFRYDYTDKQESERAITPVGAIGGLGNVDESEITGAEFDLQWVPIDGLTITAGGAYLDSEIKEWDATVGGTFSLATGTITSVITQDSSGLDLPQSPQWSYNFMARYEWSISNGLMMDIGADVNFTDEMPDPVRTENSIDDYTLFNARIGIGEAEGEWRVMLWGRNITDEDYFTSGSAGPNGGFTHFVGMPVTYGVSLNYNF